MDSAESLIKSAEKELKRWGFFAGEQKYENAADYFRRAAAQYKKSKDFELAGATFLRAAECFEHIRSGTEACSAYKEAGKAFKQEPNFPKARDAFSRCILYYTDMNRFRDAAKLYTEIAGTYLEERNIQAAIEAYIKSSEAYIADDNQDQASKQLLEVAHHSAALDDYETAIRYYEDSARQNVNDQMMRWSVKGYLFSACLCQLCLAAKNDTLENASDALQRYCDLSEIFRGTREQKLIENLITAMMNGDQDQFEHFTAEFDNISPFKNWQVDRLLYAKNHGFGLGSGGNDDDEPDFNNIGANSKPAAREEEEEDGPFF